MPPADDSRRGSNAGSVLLQDMLREKKAQTQRVTKTYASSSNGYLNLDDRKLQSSPLATLNTQDRSGAQGRRGSGVAKQMGLKEMEDHISKINKQNFDLKLELFHRRQRNEDLEKRLEKIQVLEADNQEMQAINEDLLLELEKRDIAIQEAVSLICELEAKIEEMAEAEKYFRQRFRTLETRSADPDTQLQMLAHTVNDEDRAQSESTPPRVFSLSPNTSRPLPRVPSFIRDAEKSTNMLRSLYSSDGSRTQGNLSSLSLARPGSLFSGGDDDDYMDRQMLNSPRLSILSESGFSSIYGNRKDHSLSPPRDNESRNPDQLPSNNQYLQHNRHQARLHQWLGERDRPSTPKPQISETGLNDQFSSIDQVMERPPPVNEDLQLEKSPRNQPKPRQERTPEKRQHIRGHQKKPSSPAFGGPMFGGGILPPTPDTMSITAANSSTPSIITEKSLLDGTPYPTKGYSSLIPDARPHTAHSSTASNFGTALVYQAASLDESNDEQMLPRFHRKYHDSSEHLRRSPQVSPSRSRAPNGIHRQVRPSLTTSATDTNFSSDSHSPIQASRTLSFPSPISRTSCSSNQLSPVNSKGSYSASEKTATLSSRDPPSAESASTTPRRRSPRDMNQRSTISSQHTTKVTSITALPPLEPSPKMGRSSSLRAKMASMSLTPSQSSHKGVASRLFRRSNSQNIQIPPSPQPNSPSRPPVAHASLPRPLNPHGSSPIYARPGTATGSEKNVAERSFLPINARRHSAVLDQGSDGWDQGYQGARVHQRRESDSKPTMRTDEVKKRGLGRSASVKIKEGFSFKRSMSTQHV